MKQKPEERSTRTAWAESVSQLCGERTGLGGSEAEVESTLQREYEATVPSRSVVCRTQTQVQGPVHR